MSELWTIFWRDVYTPVWPNIAASPITGAFVLASHIVRERNARARHEEIKAIAKGGEP